MGTKYFQSGGKPVPLSVRAVAEFCDCSPYYSVYLPTLAVATAKRRGDDSRNFIVYGVLEGLEGY